MSPAELELAITEIGLRMNSQDDSHCTNAPIFLVEQRRRYYGIDPEWTDDVAWLHDGEEVSPEEAVKLEEDYYNDWTVPEDHVRTGYMEVWQFVTCFFTRDGADGYIEHNKHKYNDLRVTVDSLYRNHEMQVIQKYLSHKGER